MASRRTWPGSGLPWRFGRIDSVGGCGARSAIRPKQLITNNSIAGGTMKYLMAIALMALSACSTTPVSLENGMYYLDGIDRSDGMSAQLSEKNESLRIASEGFTAKSCVSDSTPVCFANSYMVFSYPGTDAETWRSDEYEFARIGIVIYRNDRIAVIRSVQRCRTFYFYFNRQSGLIGWDLLYRSVIDGTPATDRWRRLNFGPLRWTQSNDSFKLDHSPCAPSSSSPSASSSAC